jgi:hypothetical protein
MNVLIDHHHGALFKSFYYLLKCRLNYNVYVPTGLDWLDKEGLYSSYPNRGTSDQMLNSWTHDSKNLKCFLPILLQNFENLNIDVIICSLLENYKIFENIIKKYNKNCKLILHIGNNNLPALLEQMNVKNLMSSSWPVYLLSNIPNKVFCRQEFSLNFFKPKYDCNIKSIANYKHILEEEEFNYFKKLETKLPDWQFKCYGICNPDGIINGDEENISESIRNFGFIYHFKKVDEGYGHSIHNAFACGKPVITNSNYMKFANIGNTASLLFESGVSTLDVYQDSIEQIVYKLEKMADNYQVSSQNVYNKFINTVDFEKESESVKQFMERLT